MRLIACGSRDWTNYEEIERTLLSFIHQFGKPAALIHGAARGADTLAGQAAQRLGIPVEEYPADWRGNGKGAGPIRNRQMLDTGADYVIAFKDAFDTTLRKGGTENMIRIAREAGVPTWVIGRR